MAAGSDECKMLLSSLTRARPRIAQKKSQNLETFAVRTLPYSAWGGILKASLAQSRGTGGKGRKAGRSRKQILRSERDWETHKVQRNCEVVPPPRISQPLTRAHLYTVDTYFSHSFSEKRSFRAPDLTGKEALNEPNGNVLFSLSIVAFL